MSTVHVCVVIQRQSDNSAPTTAKWLLPRFATQTNHNFRLAGDRARGIVNF
jgi:hypothetical protein